MTPSNPPKQPAKPNADEVLDNLYEAGYNSGDGFKNGLKVDHMKEAKHQMADDLISVLPEKVSIIASTGRKESDTMDRTWGKTEGYNQAIDEATESIRAYFGVNGEGE
jgi:hypothetical protein